MASLSELKFFTTPAHECSYLAGREAITMFVDPSAEIDQELYGALSSLGFRRSGSHIYRPNCRDCSACVPVRIPVATFQNKRSQLRCWKKNQDLVVRKVPPSFTEEYFELYCDYISHRHADGDMFPPEADQFRSFLVDGRREASFYEFRKDGTLLAVAVADQLKDALSAIYSFFNPAEAKRSIGTFAVLWLIEETRRLGLTHLYLGYWIKQCQKMNYKIDYRPTELFIKNHWISLD